MRAVFRFGNLLLAGALALAPVTALAQETPPSDSSTPAADAIGPSELQNFSLNGTVTRPAEQPAPIPAPLKRQPAAQTQLAPPAVQPSTALTDRTANRPATQARETATTQTAATETPPAAAPQSTPEALPQPTPSSSVTVALPKLGGADSASTDAAPAASSDFAPAPATPSSEHKFPTIPWLLAALALAGGAAFLFWRNHAREAFAGGPQVDAFVAPEPAPAPAPRPSPAPPAPAPKATPPAAAGVVSTRLRPWIDIGFHPLRCVLEDERLTVEFELELFNSGSAPARAVLAEATVFNAGPAQDQQIAGFFANPVAAGERMPIIPPLKRIALRTQVVAERAQLQAYELAGRQVFVPIVAFNALYSWSGGEGQTSSSYLLGKDTKGDKLAPFRLDLGPHIFRGLAAHVLPTAVRR